MLKLLPQGSETERSRCHDDYIYVHGYSIDALLLCDAMSSIQQHLTKFYTLFNRFSQRRDLDLQLVDILKRVSISLIMDSYVLLVTVAEPYVNWLLFYFLQSPLKSPSTHKLTTVSIVDICVPSGSGKLSDVSLISP